MITAQNISKTFPQEYNPLINMFETDEILIELVKQFIPAPQKEIHNFVFKITLLFQKRNLELYRKILSLWINTHQIPLSKILMSPRHRELPSRYQQIRPILPSLEYLDFSDLPLVRFGFKSCYNKDNIAEFIQLIKDCKRIKHFSCASGLKKYGLQLLGIPMDEPISWIITNNTNLESLDVSWCKFEKNDLFGSLQKLNKLNIKDIQLKEELSDEDLSFFTNRLCELSITPTGLSNEGFKKIGKCEHLRRLDLSSSIDKKFPDLSPLQNLTNLEALSISHTVEEIDLGFLEHIKLKELTLYRCYNITNAIGSQLKTVINLKISEAREISYQVVKDMGALEILELENCVELGMNSFEPLTKLKFLHTLVLNLPRREITVGNTEKLYSLKDLPSLKHLIIKDSSYSCVPHSKEWIDRLRDALPTLEIICQ